MGRRACLSDEWRNPPGWIKWKI